MQHSGKEHHLPDSDFRLTSDLFEAPFRDRLTIGAPMQTLWRSLLGRGDSSSEAERKTDGSRVLPDYCCIIVQIIAVKMLIMAII